MDNLNKRLVLYDTDTEYAELMGEYLRSHREAGWDVSVFSDGGELLRGLDGRGVSLLLVSERAYTEDIRELGGDRLILLTENGKVATDGVKHTEKYQRADELLKRILFIYLDTEKTVGEVSATQLKYKTAVIGFYSPVKRCFQTTTALTLAKLLSERGRVLYLNFEAYVGETELSAYDGRGDLADLLYFASEELGRFKLRLRTIAVKNGELDYVPAMRSGQNLIAVSKHEWLGLIKKLADCGEYEYIVMDISDSLQGIFDILRSCKAIFAITKDDKSAERKLSNYETLLVLYEYEDVKEKLKRISIPKIKRLPAAIEQYGRGELADYVRANMVGELI